MRSSRAESNSFPHTRTHVSGSIHIGGQLVSAWSYAGWSSKDSLNGALALADPITAFADGEAVVSNQDQVSGKVVLIKRAVIPSGERKGQDGHGVQALAAQNAGAIGVVFANNDEENADAVVGMYSTGEAIHVPVVMISRSEGERAIELGAGAPVVIAGLDVEIDA